MGDSNLLPRKIKQSAERAASRQSNGIQARFDLDTIQKEYGESKAVDGKTNVNVLKNLGTPAEENSKREKRLAHWKQVLGDLDSGDTTRVNNAVRAAQRGYEDWNDKPNPKQRAADYFKKHDGSVDLQKVKAFIKGFIQFDAEKIREYNQENPITVEQLLRQIQPKNT